MTNKFLPLLALLFIAGGCGYFSNSKDKPGNIVIKRDSASHKQAYFNGTIRFVEKTPIGVSQFSKQNVVISIKGNSLKRTVSEGMSSEVYGLIVPETGDSVTIYATNNTSKMYFRIHRAAYLETVSKNQTSDFWGGIMPFSNIFEPLADRAASLNHLTSGNADIGNLKNCKLTVIPFTTSRICSVVYSDDVMVPKSLLAYIEFNQPLCVPTLALTVHYTAVEKKSSGILETIKNKAEKILDGIITDDLEMESIDFNEPPGNDFELSNDFVRVGDWGAIQSIFNPEPVESGDGHHHHHHH